MKKLFFLLTLSGLLINAPLHICASDNDHTKDHNKVGLPCRIKFQSKCFDYGCMLMPLDTEDFSIISNQDPNKSLRGKEEIVLKVDSVITAFKDAGWTESGMKKQRSIFEKHSKKFIATALVLGFTGGAIAMRYFDININLKKFAILVHH